MNVTSPVSGSSVYVPTFAPSFVASIVVSSTAVPFTTNLAGWSESTFNGTSASPSVNFGVPV